MANATISYGPKLGLLNNASINEVYYDQFRPFLRGVDALVQASVKGSLTGPPATPNNGDAYIVIATATGLWIGQETKIAVFSNQITLPGTNTLSSGWDFYTPQTGWWVFNTSNNLYYFFNGTSWVSSLATTSMAGFVKPDGTSVTIDGSGIISAAGAPIATTGTLGLVKVDGTSITISGGGTISAGTHSLPVATTSVLGGVKPDGTTITVSGTGVISVPTATNSVLGIVKPDNLTVLISGGVLSMNLAGTGSGWGGPAGTGTAGGFFVQALGAESVTQLTLASPVTSGNTLVVVISQENGGHVSSVTDNLGNSYSLSSYGGSGITYYIANNLSTGGACTVTANHTGTYTATINVLEYQGLPTGSIDVAGVGTSGGALGPVTLGTQCVVVLYHENDDVSGTVSAPGAATRYFYNPGTGAIYTGDILVNAGSFAINITPDTAVNYSGFLALRTT